MYREGISFIFVLLGIAILALTSIDYLIERRGGDLIEDDSPAEEFIEEIIKEKTGISVDLSWDSKEEDVK